MISTHNFNFYPEIQNIDFYKKIFMKKEFHKILDKKNNITNSDFKLLPQQEFLKNFISKHTPYNSVLIFHGTGVGKTCTAIRIAEGFKNILKKKKKKIIVLLQRNIRENFIKELYNIDKPDNKQCVGTEYKFSSIESNLEKDKKLFKIKKKIKEYYKFYGYKEFTNKILKLCEWDGKLNNISDNTKRLILKYYSNTVLIIDEVHHIKSTTKDNITKKIPQILEGIITFSKNIKLVMMSATPLYDSPKEIVFLLNLMLLNDNRNKLYEKDLFDKDDNLKKNAEEILEKNLRGYISYFRGEQIGLFPSRIYAKESITPIFKYNIKGNPMKEQMKYIKIYPCYMSNIHYNYYLNSINKIKNKNIENKTIISEMQISNIIYPTKNGKYTYSSNGYQNSNNGLGSFYRISKKILKKKKTYFKYQDHCIFDKDKKDEKPFLDLDIIKQYSSKIYEILKNIISSNGISYIYSEYVDSGALPIALALEQAGYERYVYNNENQLLDYTKNNNGGGGKHKPVCYKCGHSIDYAEHKKGHKNYHEFKVGKYILIAGDFVDNKVLQQKYINILNSNENKEGELIKILIGTRITSEGIDMKGIRQIHIVEPWWNMSRIEQIIGRGIRHKSHLHLDDKSRNVEIFLHS